MKIKSLLAAVSMVAITAGSANALIISNTTPGGTITPALELDTPLATDANLGMFSLEVAPNANARFPSGTNLVVTIALPNGVTFATDVEGVDISGEAESAVVQGGSGEAGSSSVQFLADMADTTVIDAPLIFNFDLALSDCPSGTVVVTVATENGTPIEQGSVALAAGDALIGECAPALSAMVMSDEATSDTFLTLASDYQNFDGDQGTAFIDGTLGTIQLKSDPDVSVVLNPATPLDETDIESVSFDVCFDDATGIESVRVGNTLGVKSGNTFSFEVTDQGAIATLLLAPNRIIATETDEDAISTQTPTVKNVSVVFDDTNADLIDSKALSGGSLDALQREGIEFGYFDWNSGPAGAQTLSVYRVTGLEPGAAVDYSINVENSNNNGTYTGTMQSNGFGEATLVSTLMPVPADTERFDFQITIETAEEDVDIDRLLLTDGVVTAYGDGANSALFNGQGQQPNTDFDDQQGSE